MYLYQWHSNRQQTRPINTCTMADTYMYITMTTNKVYKYVTCTMADTYMYITMTTNKVYKYMHNGRHLHVHHYDNKQGL